MKYYFNLNLSTEDYLPYYQGRASTIVVTTVRGVTLEFPAMHLRRYLTAVGIKGHFCLETQNNKFLSLSRVS
ncbi:MAG: DUF2835 domain-containing protein [Cognaticolwellia sp.]